jgi:phosphopantothenate-cysteine ligase
MLSLAFDEATQTQLNQDKQLLSTISSLSQSVHERTKHAAENLHWQLENGHKTAKINTSTDATRTYDIMISYSHTEKELCYQIHEQLARDGYRVWIDRDQLHAETIAEMAKAIENSECVLICMSDAYKQSSYCQLEANYAFEQRCRLIPLIMTLHYKPDGWLGILVSGKIYVNFPKLRFDLAYAKLKSSINQYRQLHVQCKRQDSIDNQSVRPATPTTPVIPVILAAQPPASHTIT